MGHNHQFTLHDFKGRTSFRISCRSVIDEDSWKIEEPGKPGHHKDNMERFKD